MPGIFESELTHLKHFTHRIQALLLQVVHSLGLSHGEGTDEGGAEDGRVGQYRYAASHHQAQGVRVSDVGFVILSGQGNHLLIRPSSHLNWIK